jgi:hypothetical protein
VRLPADYPGVRRCKKAEVKSEQRELCAGVRRQSGVILTFATLGVVSDDQEARVLFALLGAFYRRRSNHPTPPEKRKDKKTILWLW